MEKARAFFLSKTIRFHSKIEICYYCPHHCKRTMTSKPTHLNLTLETNILTHPNWARHLSALRESLCETLLYDADAECEGTTLTQEKTAPAALTLRLVPQDIDGDTSKFTSLHVMNCANRWMVEKGVKGRILVTKTTEEEVRRLEAEALA